MAVIVVCSAKGSPGATTAAMLLAAVWPRQVLLVDADPAGGDIALKLPRADGRPIDTGKGLLTLLPLARRALAPSALFDHAQTLNGGTPLLAGLDGPEQAGAVGPLWATLGQAFASGETDVLIDAGRVHSRSVHLPLLQQADGVLVVFRPTVSGVVRTRELVRSLAPRLRAPDGTGPLMVLAPICRVDRPTEADAAVATAASGAAGVAGAGVEHLGNLADDPTGASIFDGAAVRRPERTLLVRSGRQLAAALDGRLVRPSGQAEALRLLGGPVPPSSDRALEVGG